MSEENVEIAKRFNAVSRRGNVEDYIEGGLEFFADDIVITNLGAPLDIPPTVHGREAARRSWERLTQVFDDFTREIEEWVDEDDWVITVGRWVATGEGSGLRVERRDASALRFDRGKIVEWIIGLPDKQAALEAAGLSELAMSEENVELGLRGVDAWNRGDLGWILDHLTKDFEFHTMQLFPDLDPIYSGHDGWRAFWRTWRDAWETVTIRVERIEDLGDRALVVVAFDGVGRGSGASVSMSFGQIWTFRDGLVARIDVFDPQEALEAAGLSE